MHELKDLRKKVKKNEFESIRTARREIASRYKKEKEYLTYLKAQEYIEEKRLSTAIELVSVSIAIAALFFSIIRPPVVWFTILLMVVMLISLTSLLLELRKVESNAYIFAVAREMADAENCAENSEQGKLEKEEGK